MNSVLQEPPITNANVPGNLVSGLLVIIGLAVVVYLCNGCYHFFFSQPKGVGKEQLTNRRDVEAEKEETE